MQKYVDRTTVRPTNVETGDDDVNVKTGDDGVNAALSEALKSGDYFEISDILEQNPNIKLSEHVDTIECLDRAIRKGECSLVTTLIDGGADVDHKDRFGSTLLHIAISRDNIKWLIIMKLLEVNPSLINSTNDRDEKPLCNMGSTIRSSFGDKKDRKILEIMIDQGADVNCKDYMGNTLLHRAVEMKSIDMALMLLRHGADINAKNKYGATLIKNIFDIVAVPEDKESFWPRDRDEILQTTMIFYLQMMKILLENGADINTMDSIGQTLLIQAIMHKINMDEVVGYMLDFTPSGEFPNQMVLNLEKRVVGMDPTEAPDSRGMRALHYACVMKKHHIVALLLEAGANSYAKDFDGEDALDIALTVEDGKEDERLVKIVLEHRKAQCDTAARRNRIDRACHGFRHLARNRAPTDVADVAAIHRRLQERDYYPESAREPFDDHGRAMADDEDILYHTLPIQSRYPRLF